MSRLVVVRAVWDSEAAVWTAESPDVPGLVTEAASFDELERKLPDLIRDMIEDGRSDFPAQMEIPVEIIASYSTKIIVDSEAA